MLGQLHERPGLKRLAPTAADDVHEDVDAPALGEHALDHGVDLRFVADVGGDAESARAPSLDRGDSVAHRRVRAGASAGHFLGFARDDDDVRAVLREFLAAGEAESLRSAGNDGHSAGEVEVHDALLVFSCWVRRGQWVGPPAFGVR